MKSLNKIVFALFLMLFVPCVLMAQTLEQRKQSNVNVSTTENPSVFQQEMSPKETNSIDGLTQQLQQISNNLYQMEFSPEGFVDRMNLDNLNSVNVFNVDYIQKLNIPYIKNIISGVNVDIQDNTVSMSDLTAMQYAKDIALKILKARKNGQSKIIVVNIPNYTLDAIDTTTGDLVFQSKVVVGERTKKTPRFTTDILSFTLNPTWTPTPSILKASVYPSVGKPKGYAGRTGMVAVGADGKLIDLGSPDVTAYGVKGLHIYQPSGIDNALGLLRFNTDNKLDIFLHDSNQHYLFKRTKRAYSHGCVRVQEWQKMALWLSGWSEKVLQERLDTHKTETYLLKKVTVNIVDYPFAVTDNGIVALEDPYAIFTPNKVVKITVDKKKSA